MTRDEREQRRRDLRDALRLAVKSGADWGEIMYVADEYARATAAADMALCAEACACPFCDGWLQGHDRDNEERRSPRCDT